ncbi:MAG TPA: ABC transporter permease, partial [Acetobacteraceae bacterium]|nr:ABC transporter permease [Acetobacteraceae bacterium]
MIAVLPRLSVRHLATALGALIVGGVLLVAIIAPLIAPHDPFAQDLNLRLTPPEWMDGGTALHPFGTD